MTTIFFVKKELTTTMSRIHKVLKNNYSLLIFAVIRSQETTIGARNVDRPITIS